MAEIPLNATIYGFAFTDDLSETDMKEINQNLLKKGLKDLKDVVFSVYDDKDCTWIVAADRYLSEDEVRDTVDYIIDNNIEDIFILIDFRAKDDRNL